MAIYAGNMPKPPVRRSKVTELEVGGVKCVEGRVAGDWPPLVTSGGGGEFSPAGGGAAPSRVGSTLDTAELNH